jgi:DNA helicase-2/ATP-dependent DNA helicase PcrA
LKRLDSAEALSLRHAQEAKPFVLEAIRIARENADQKYPGEFSIQGTGALAVESLLEEFSYLKGTLGIQRFGDNFRYDPATADELGCGFTVLAVFRQYEKARCGFVPPDGWGAKFRYSGDPTYDMARHLLADDAPWDGASHPFNLGLEGIVLDEMHDCAWSMFTVIRQLIELNPQATFMGVGDRDQVIHGKHGADSYFMGPDLDHEIGVVSRFPLTLAHRFGRQIAHPLALFSQKGYQATDSAATQVTLRTAAGANDNAGIIFEIISRHKMGAGSTRDDFAVLWRHPGASVEIEHHLILKGLGYQTIGFKPFLQRPEIAFARMLLSIAVDHPTQFMAESLADAKRAVWQFLGADLPAPNTAEETEHIIEAATEPDFKRFVFPGLLGEVDKKVGESVQAALKIAESDDPQDVGRFVKALNFLFMAQKVFVSQRDVQEATFSIESFAAVATHYDTINGMLAAMNSIDFAHRKRSAAQQLIRLSTIEDAKGLEFRHVFIPDCNAKTFDGLSQDERNLFYVAASRARDHLVISYKKGEQSSYLKHFMSSGD